MNAAATTPSVDIGGRGSCASRALTISIGNPKVFAHDACRRSSSWRGVHEARRKPPSRAIPDRCRSAASARAYSLTEYCIIRVSEIELRSWPTRPAWCQVDPCAELVLLDEHRVPVHPASQGGRGSNSRSHPTRPLARAQSCARLSQVRIAWCPFRPSSQRFPSCTTRPQSSRSRAAWDQHELQGRLPSRDVCGTRLGKGDEPARDRPENEAHNTTLRRRQGVGRAVFVAWVPELNALVFGFLDGRVMSPETLRHDDRLPAVARACRRVTAGARFLRDFEMSELQRGYVDVVQRRIRLPDRYLEFEPQVRALEEANARSVREPSAPCNSDLLAENFIDCGGELAVD